MLTCALEICNNDSMEESLFLYLCLEETKSFTMKSNYQGLCTRGWNFQICALIKKRHTWTWHAEFIFLFIMNVGVSQCRSSGPIPPINDAWNQCVYYDTECSKCGWSNHMIQKMKKNTHLAQNLWAWETGQSYTIAAGNRKWFHTLTVSLAPRL